MKINTERPIKSSRNIDIPLNSACVSIISTNKEGQPEFELESPDLISGVLQEDEGTILGMHKAERQRRELERYKHKLRAQMDKIKIYLGINCNIDNLLVPNPGLKEQALITLHKEAKYKI